MLGDKSNGAKANFHFRLLQILGDSKEAQEIIAAQGLAPVVFDEMDITYVAAGNGVGEVETVIYKYGGVSVLTLTLTYDAQNRVVNVVKS